MNKINKICKKIAASIAAAALCITPMAESLTANAVAHVNEEGVIVWRGNVNGDSKYDYDDYWILRRYFKAQWSGDTETINYLKKKYKSIRIDNPYYDMNGDGATDEYDLKFFELVIKNYSNYDQAAKFFFPNNAAYLKGDANGDLVFDHDDAFDLWMYLKDGKETARIMFNRSDMDGNKVLDWNDYQQMVFQLAKDHAWDNNEDWKIDKFDINEIYEYLLKHPEDLKKLFGVEKRGDANGDGKIDMTDVIVLQQYLIDPVKYPTAGKNIETANTFGNREHPMLSIGDLTCLQMIVSGYTTKNGNVDLNARIKDNGKSVYVFAYYDKLNEQQALRENWHSQYIYG